MQPPCSHDIYLLAGLRVQEKFKSNYKCIAARFRSSTGQNAQFLMTFLVYLKTAYFLFLLGKSYFFYLILEDN